MEQLNARLHELLDWIFEMIEPFGASVAVIAWVTVFTECLGLAALLMRRPIRQVWRPALAVGGASLLAHVLDYAVTLRVSPDLGIEANPLWRIVIERWGLGPAKIYGLSGKVLLAVLSFELFAFYLLQRTSLFPESAASFADFWRHFGARRGPGGPVDWKRVASFFSYSFALVGPFFFYVALLNSLAESPAYNRLPAMPIVLGLYLAATTASYLVLTYRAFLDSAAGN